MRVLVFGSRTWREKALIYDRMDRLVFAVESEGEHPRDCLVITGGATGADSVAHAAAKMRGFGTLIMPADWNTHGRRAGYIRNDAMLDELELGPPGEDRLAIAFWHGRSSGTRHTIRGAMARDLPLELHWRP